jgi:hypothetical protein
MAEESSDVDFEDSEESCGYNPNEYLEEDLRSEEYAKHKNFSGVVRDLKIKNEMLRKGFDGKAEQWGPEVLEHLGERLSPTVYGVPKDPSGYPVIKEETFKELSEKYQTPFSGEEERKEFETNLKAAAYMNGVPKHKLEQFADTFFDIREESIKEAGNRIHKFFQSQLEETNKMWGDQAEANTARLYRYLETVLPKTHPGGAEQGEKAAKVLIDSGAIANKHVANFFLKIAEEYLPSPVKTASSKNYKTSVNSIGSSMSQLK